MVDAERLGRRRGRARGPRLAVPVRSPTAPSLVASWPSDRGQALEGRLPRDDLIPLDRAAQAGGPRQGVAFLPTLPRVRLVIVGAGHVGQGVASLAAQADFDVWVVDDRRQYASAERFPRPPRSSIVGPIDEGLHWCARDHAPHTYALIVTRGHGHDQEALHHLAPTPASYVGLIGSRRKIRLIFESLREDGDFRRRGARSRVTAPLGFDIGSQTVPEIAVSIVAELIARRNLGTGQAMVLRPPVDRDGEPSHVPPASRPLGMIAAIVPAAGQQSSGWAAPS